MNLPQRTQRAQRKSPEQAVGELTEWKAWKERVVDSEWLAKRENQLSGIILDAAITVHSAIGPGLLESAYQACLAYELTSRGIEFQAQVPYRFDTVNFIWM